MNKVVIHYKINLSRNTRVSGKPYSVSINSVDSGDYDIIANWLRNDNLIQTADVYANAVAFENYEDKVHFKIQFIACKAWSSNYQEIKDRCMRYVKTPIMFGDKNLFPFPASMSKQDIVFKWIQNHTAGNFFIGSEMLYFFDDRDALIYKLTSGKVWQ